MTLIEKKMRTLGLRGKPMYLKIHEVREMREKFPAANLVRIADPAPMIDGYHAYIVENWKGV